VKSIKAPVLITLGDRDGVKPEHAVEMFRLVPNAKLAMFPGGDHFLIWTSPNTVLGPVAVSASPEARLRDSPSAALPFMTQNSIGQQLSSRSKGLGNGAAIPHPADLGLEL
jgi:pimeloyl-ACP methyl ester carboxylesterase